MSAEREAPFVPRFTCLDAPGVSRLLYEWLLRPSLESATLVSFAFDPDYRWIPRDAPTQRIVHALQRAAGLADVTVVVATKVIREPTDAGQRRRAAMVDLEKAGATVLLHETLHAKAYLFEEEGRCCWVVGSSNLTAGGLTNNSEVSLRGFHPADYRAVRGSVLRLVADAEPYSP